MAGNGCGHRPAVLKCSGIDSCEKCLKVYQSGHAEHWIASTAKEMRNSDSLMKGLQTEQINTSAMLEYLDELRDRLVSEVDRKVNDTKKKIEETACRYNYKIQSLYARLNSTEVTGREEAKRDFEEMRALQSPINAVYVGEARFKQVLEELIEAKCEEIGARQAPSLTSNDFLADFVDSSVVKIINIARPQESRIGTIEGDYRLYPKSRYCFVNGHQLVATGGEMSGFPILNSYIISFGTEMATAESHSLPFLNNARADHATCLFSLQSLHLVYVFGTSKLIEYLPSSSETWDLHTAPFRNGQGNAAALDWRKSRTELPCFLSPAACVSHLGFIYITGSSLEPCCSIYGFSPQKDLETEESAISAYKIYNSTVRQPCAMACWHTLIVVLYREAGLIRGLKWSIGNSLVQDDSRVALEYDKDLADEVQLAPICPSITRDSNCFLLTEARERTYLLRFNFIKKSVGTVGVDWRVE